MADRKMSALDPVGRTTVADEIAIRRGGGNYRVPERILRRFFLYTYNSSDTDNSLIHQACAAGDVCDSAWSDVSKVPGSGGRWECLNTTAGSPNGVPGAASGRLTLQGTYGQWALIPQTQYNIAQMMVRTKDGTSEQSRLETARDVAQAVDPNRRKLIGEGRITVSSTVSMRYAQADFSRLCLQEPAAGFAGPILEIGDPGNAFGLAEPTDYRYFVNGINVGPNSTSGPGATPGYDWAGAPGQASSASIPSIATGIRVVNADSMMTFDLRVARCAIGVHVMGNTEKVRIHVQAAYCSLAIKEEGPAVGNSGTPDTCTYYLTGNVCKQWFVSGEDTTCVLDIDAESRIDDGSGFPAAYNAGISIPTPGILISNGKHQVLKGKVRAHNGRQYIYVDRLTSALLGGQGSDTFTIDGFTATHTYGTILCVDRLRNLNGAGLTIKDHGPGRNNYADTASTLDSSAVQLNRIDSECSLPMHLCDIYSARGITIGDTAKGLFPTRINFGPMFIEMRSGAGVAFQIDKAVACRFNIEACNADVVINADALDCHVDLPVSMILAGKEVTNGGTGCTVHFRGVIASTDLPGWATIGMSVQALSDYDGRPAFFDGSDWKVASYESL